MYSKLREKTGRRFVQKYFGGKPIRMGQAGEREIGADGTVYECLGGGTWVQKTFGDLEVPDVTQMSPQTTELFSYGSEDGALGKTTVSATNTGISSYNTATGQTTEVSHADAVGGTEDSASLEEMLRSAKAAKLAERDANFRAGFGGAANGTVASAIGNFKDGNWKTGLVDTAVAGMKAVDNMAMGDKNFGAQSEAIDSAVHGVSSALMKSGNPYAMAAGAALEGANFLTKAGGQTVQGFDVDINSSGYGDLGHMESSSSRDFGAMIGLGGIFGQKSLQRKLQKRNQQALMAMNAANIAEDQKFEQEARMNSIQNVIMNNQIALSGGLETNLLGG